MTKEHFIREQERLQSELADLKASYIASQDIQPGDKVEVTDVNNKVIQAQVAKAFINHKNDVRYDFNRIKPSGETWAQPVAIPYIDNNSIRKV